MAQVHPTAVIEEDVWLADDVIIGPNCVIKKGVRIDSGTKVEANAVIGEKVRIGKNKHFFSNCVIGGVPQILNLEADTQIGGLEIGNDNNIREQVTIHPSSYPGEVTKVGNGNLLMVGVHIGHDCILEDEIVMSNFTQVSGHCKIETGAWLSGVVLLHQFVTIGRWSYAAGLAGINKDIPPFLIVSGHYPSRIRGVNKRGLKRAGFSEEQQNSIVEAYKKLYRRKGALLENAKALIQENGLDENAKTMVDAIINSNKHRFGRYLETFRH